LSLCFGDQAELDFGGKRNPVGQGFASFGRVAKGMEMARKIQVSKAEGQTLSPPVEIMKVMRKASRQGPCQTSATQPESVSAHRAQ
jgi:peptidyl-prolyl cis-trans isomerase A (cyclophilin A)